MSQLGGFGISLSNANMREIKITNERNFVLTVVQGDKRKGRDNKRYRHVERQNGY
jgi:hypothetical protein